MEYGTMPSGKRQLATGRSEMKIKLVETTRDSAIFSVDGREIEVPENCRIGKDKKNFSDMKPVFYPERAIDYITRKPVDELIQQAIADHLKKQALAEGLDIDVVMEKTEE